MTRKELLERAKRLAERERLMRERERREAMTSLER